MRANLRRGQRGFAGRAERGRGPAFHQLRHGQPGDPSRRAVAGGARRRAEPGGVHGVEHHAGARGHALPDVRRQAGGVRAGAADPGGAGIDGALRRRGRRGGEGQGAGQHGHEHQHRRARRRPGARRGAGPRPDDAARNLRRDRRGLARVADGRRGHAEPRARLLFFRRPRREGFAASR